MVEIHNLRRYSMLIVAATAALLLIGCKGADTTDSAGKGDVGQVANGKPAGTARPLGQGVK